MAEKNGYGKGGHLNKKRGSAYTESGHGHLMGEETTLKSLWNSDE